MRIAGRGDEMAMGAYDVLLDVDTMKILTTTTTMTMLHHSIHTRRRFDHIIRYK